MTPAREAMRGLADGSSSGIGGEFVRGATSFHGWVEGDGSGDFPPALRVVPKGRALDFSEAHGRG